MGNLQSFGTAVVVVALVVIVFLIVKTPIKWVFKLIMNTLLGFVALFLINWLGGFIGINLAVNWINALVVGVFGIPGIALLLLLQWLMII